MEEDNGQIIAGYTIRHIENETEKLVAKALDKSIMSGMAKCNCQLCIEDMYMFSLNSLPARYKHQATLKLTRNDPRLTGEMVEEAVNQAVKAVSDHPKHG